MKKTKNPKLSLQAQTIRVLDADTLGRVAGGTQLVTANCFIMKDTVIIPRTR